MPIRPHGSPAVIRAVLLPVALPLVLTLSAAPAVATPGAVVVATGPHVATRADDGTTTLELGIWNLSTDALTLGLAGPTGCAPPADHPLVAASTQGDVSFTMHCSAGREQRAAVLTATPGDGAPTRVDVTFTLGQSGPAGSAMLLFLLGILVGVVAAVPPYLMWRRNPLGNPDPAGDSGTDNRRDPDLGRGWKAGWRTLGLTLPGITKDWSFTDSWASNAGLATALFTGLFAATDPLKALLGTDSSQTQDTIVIASALAAALIGAAPLLLVICKRRYRTEDGVARHHTVAGVLAATVVVVTASTGLVLTAAGALGGLWPWVTASTASAVLLVYSWKSIPQTLALGRYEEPVRRARWEVDLSDVGGLKGQVVEGAETQDEAERRSVDHRPGAASPPRRRPRAAVSSLP